MADETNNRRKLHVYFTEEAWVVVENAVKEANRDFEDGNITFSDAVNEMVLCSKFDVKSIQAKHTNFKRSLRRIASQSDVDLDSAIKALMELKAKTQKRGSKATSHQEEVS